MKNDRFKALRLSLGTLMLLSASFFVVTQGVQAQVQPQSTGTVQPQGTATVQPQSTGTVQPSANNTLTNPLKYTSIQAIVSALLTAVEYVGGVACALWIIWAGFLFVSAQGNPEKLEVAKKSIAYALIGTGIILGAGVILTIVTNTISAIKS